MFELLKRSLKRGIVTDAGYDGFARGYVQADERVCRTCGLCASVCPTGSLSMAGRLIVEPTRCVACGQCLRVCRSGALSWSGRPAGPMSPLFGGSVAKRSRPLARVRARSLHIRHLDAGSCNACDFELSALLNPVYDIQRLGFDFVASPRHADVLMVTGAVTRNMEEAVRLTYAATPSPKVVIACGACACFGGAVKDGYAVVGAADSVLPVAVRIPGCPPRPREIIEGLEAARAVFGQIREA